MRPPRLRVIEEPGAKVGPAGARLERPYPIRLIDRAEASEKVAKSACFDHAVDIETAHRPRGIAWVGGTWPFRRPSPPDARALVVTRSHGASRLSRNNSAARSRS